MSENFIKTALANPHPQNIHDKSRQLTALTKFDGEAFLSKIKISTLIMYGPEDSFACQKRPISWLVKFQQRSSSKYRGLRICLY